MVSILEFDQKQQRFSRSTVSSGPSWTERFRSVADNIKGRFQRVLSPQKKPAIKPATLHQHVDVGLTSYHLHDTAIAKLHANSMEVYYNRRELPIQFDEDGGLTKESVTLLTTKGLRIREHTGQHNFSESVVIRQRRRVGDPGTARLMALQNTVQVHYVPARNNAGILPQVLLITLDDQPGAPILRVPIGQDGMASFSREAPVGSMERFIAEECFLQKKGMVLSRAYRMEFARIDAEEEGMVDITTLGVHQYNRRLSAYKDAPAYPALPVHTSVDITPVPTPTPPLQISKPAVTHQDHLKFLARIRARKVQEWREKHALLFDTDLLKEYAGKQPHYVQEFTRRFEAAGNLTSISLQGWLLENMGSMTVSEMTALLELDRSFRDGHLDRILPANNEQMLVDAAKKAALEQCLIKSRDPSLIHKGQSSQAGILLGEAQQIYRSYMKNIHKQEHEIGFFFGNQKLSVQRREWEYMRNQAEMLTAAFPYLSMMDSKDEAILEKTSTAYQSLYTERERLFLLASHSSVAQDPEAWTYITAAFDNTLEKPLPMPSNDQTQTLRQLCLDMAYRCQQQLVRVKTTMKSFQDAMKYREMHYTKGSILDLMYQKMPLICEERAVSQEKLHDGEIAKQLHAWEGYVDTFCTKLLPNCAPQHAEFRLTQLQAYIQKGKYLVAASAPENMSRESRKRFLGKIYSNFIIVQGHPMQLAMQLDLYLGVLLQEPSHDTFYITQSVLHRLIGLLPSSWPKKQDLMEMYEILQYRLKVSQEASIS